MKKIILLFITFFAIIPTIFADTSVDISVDKNNINTGDVLNMTLSITTDKESHIEITEILGIENFDITSQNQTSQVQIINGEVRSIQGLKIGFIATQSGTYLLGPAKINIGEEEFISNQVEITINDFILPTLNENNIQNNSSENNGGEKTEENIPEKINIDTKNNDSENNDLSDIHSVKKINISFDIFEYTGVIYFGLFIIFLIIFYLFLIKILDNKKITEKNKKIESDKISARAEEIKNIYDELLELSKNPDNYSQIDFYTQLNELFRRYFLYIGIDLADKKTLSELKKDNIDTKILDIFSMSYMYEFSTENDSLSERKQIIMNFIIFLKK